MEFAVQLDAYQGPLDLLLYLVRKHEIEITDIPIAQITQQFLEHLEVLTELNVDDAGDFLEMASMLVEIKARQVLPAGDDQPAEVEDPREELVQRLLEYKKYKDAASILEEQSRQWQQRFTRLADDLPPRRVDPADQPIHEVELWDLVSALGRVLRDASVLKPPSIIYDETPIQVYMQRIHGQLVEHGRMAFSEAFDAGMHKSALIGMFLSILELVRHHSVRAEQNDVHGEIWILPGDNFNQSLELSDVDNYGGTPTPDEEAGNDESADQAQ